MPYLPRPFDHFYIPEPNSGCWLWIGSERESGGYGFIVRNGRSTAAHRVSYEMAKGPIPEGLVIDHLCRVHCCVNPDHLEAVTQLVNVRRGLHGVGPRDRSELRRIWRQTPKGKAAKQREYQNRKLRKGTSA